ncbi:MAG: hypothetical protein IPK70_01295 [Flavobacteriales bacterium]|nr:hypothetical protein [Flavobacteriales bacterium]
MTDALYMPSVYKDCIVDGNSLGDWYLNPAPNFFPDMVLYSAMNALVVDFRLASYLYPIVQFVLIGLLLRAILMENRVVGDDKGIAAGFLMMVLPVFSGWWDDDFITTFQLLINAYHMGALVNALIATWLLLRLVGRIVAWELAALIAVVLLGAISDKLFWLMFVGPATLASLLLCINPTGRPRAIVLTSLIPLSVLSGHLLLKAVLDAFPMRLADPYALLAFDRIGSSWSWFIEQMRWYFWNGPLGVFLVMTMLAVFCGSLRSAVRLTSRWPRAVRAGDNGSIRRFVLQAMAVMFFPIVLLAPVLNGSFDGADSIRYNYAAFLLSPFALGVALGSWSPQAARACFACMLILVGAPALWACLQFRDYARLADFMPGRVTELDALAKEHGLKLGVANYWDAKVVSMFSREGLTVLPVFPDLAIFIHVNREDMFYTAPSGELMQYDFVLMHKDLDESQIADKLPVPYERIERNGVFLLKTPSWSYDPATRRPATR